MKKRSRTITVYTHRHRILWWLIIGWWWRPVKFIFWAVLGILGGFRKLKFERVD